MIRGAGLRPAPAGGPPRWAAGWPEILGPMRIDFDPAQLDRDVFYRLLTATVVPRPIAWVPTASAAGADNLAPAKFGEKRYR